MTPAQALDEIARYYRTQPQLHKLLLAHSRSVADLAVELASLNNLSLSHDDIVVAGLLHDFGIIRTDAPGIFCYGTEPYIRHGVIGASMLRADGVDERFARVAERHTGAGITAADISRLNLPLPQKNYLPETQLERLICFADKFYSKSGDGTRKPLSRVLAGMQRHGQDVAARFNALLDEFGQP